MTELKLAVTPALIRRVMEKYHYGQENREALEEAAGRLEAAVSGESGFWMRLDALAASGQEVHQTPDMDMRTEVVLTLGAGADALQEGYSKQERYAEAYMVEVLAGELLLEGYVMFNRWVAANTGLHVARYHFYGAEEALALTDMPGVLTLFPKITVACNDACCLTPSKSVIFQAQLSREEGTVCEGICAGCGNKSCPNRMEQNTVSALRWPDLLGQALSGQALPYGYERILGTGAGKRLK